MATDTSVTGSRTRNTARVKKSTLINPATKVNSSMVEVKEKVESRYQPASFMKANFTAANSVAMVASPGLTTRNTKESGWMTRRTASENTITLMARFTREILLMIFLMDLGHSPSLMETKPKYNLHLLQGFWVQTAPFGMAIEKIGEVQRIGTWNKSNFEPLQLFPEEVDFAMELEDMEPIPDEFEEA